MMTISRAKYAFNIHRIRVQLHCLLYPSSLICLYTTKHVYVSETIYYEREFRRRFDVIHSRVLGTWSKYLNVYIIIF